MYNSEIYHCNHFSVSGSGALSIPSGSRMFHSPTSAQQRPYPHGSPPAPPALASPSALCACESDNSSSSCAWDPHACPFMFGWCPQGFSPWGQGSHLSVLTADVLLFHGVGHSTFVSPVHGQAVLHVSRLTLLTLWLLAFYRMPPRRQDRK